MEFVDTNKEKRNISDLSSQELLKSGFLEVEHEEVKELLEGVDGFAGKEDVIPWIRLGNFPGAFRSGIIGEIIRGKTKWYETLSKSNNAEGLIDKGLAITDERESEIFTELQGKYTESSYADFRVILKLLDMAYGAVGDEELEQAQADTPLEYLMR